MGLWPWQEGTSIGGLSPARSPQWHFALVFQRAAAMSIVVCFYLRVLLMVVPVSLKSIFSRGGVVEHFLILPSFLELLSIEYYRSWVILDWLNKCPEHLPGTVLVGCGCEQYWWKFCPHWAWWIWRLSWGSYRLHEVILSGPFLPRGWLDIFRQLYLDQFYTSLKGMRITN